MDFLLFLITLQQSQVRSVALYLCMRKKTNELWTIIATGIKKLQISAEKGIVGYVFRTKDSVIENNMENNPFF